MARVCIVLPRGRINVFKLAAALEFWQSAAQAARLTGLQQHDLLLLSADPKYKTGDARFRVQADAHIHDIRKAELILLPAMDEDPEVMVQENPELIQWINRLYDRDAIIAALCTGTALLAGSGLLNRKACTTHWWMADRLQALYPDIRVLPERIVTTSGRLFTSAGSISSFQLLLQLIEMFYSRSVAITVSKFLQVDMDRESQSPFAMLESRKIHGDEVITRAQQLIERRVAERLTVDMLAEKVHLSRRQFIRRFQQATGDNPATYIQRVKIESVKRGLEVSRKSLTQLMQEAGYQDERSFREVFRKFTGVTPAAYRKMFGLQTG